MTPNGVGLIEYIARGGTGNGTQTDAVGYAVGATSIGIAATGTGKINAGQVIKFKGDDNGYLVQTGIDDISLGGTITLATPLRVAIPAAQTDVWTGGELKRGWGHFSWQSPSGYLVGGISPYYKDWYEAGEIAQVWLDYRYGKLDHHHKDFRQESVATSGVVQVQNFNTQERYTFSQQFVTDERGVGLVSDMAAFESFVDTAMFGGAFLWFPDRENYPDEYFSCILNKRAEPKRFQHLGWYDFDFDLRVLPAVQMPSSVPGFI